jgi:F-type H+-transporting ATPase subunit c
MRNKIMMLITGLLALASPILAQTATEAAGGRPSDATRLAGAYIAVGIASGLCGIGQGRATASAAESMARNPGAAGLIRFVFIFGLVLIESLGLYALVVTYIAR